MKTSDLNKKMNSAIMFCVKIVLVLSITLASCGLLNFLLVPTLDSSVVGISMIDANRQEDNIDIMMMGTSRTYRGVDAPYLSEELNKNVFDIVSNSATYVSIYHLLVELCKNNTPEKVFLEVSSVNFKRDTGTEDEYIYHLLTGENKEEYKNAISLDYSDLGIFEFVNYLKNFANGKFAQNVSYKVNSLPLGSTDYYDNCEYRGKGFSYANATCEGKEMVLPNSYLTNGDAWEEEHLNEKALEYFYKIIDYCNANNIELVLYSLPYPKIIIEKYYDDFTQFDISFHSYIEKYDDLVYLDFTKVKSQFMDLSTDYFYNANHCNGTGADVLSPIISEIMKEIESNTYQYNNWFYDAYEQLFV